jgi:drug/metabolite transporter (DMT)-like permease
MKPHPILVQSAMLLTMVFWGISFVASKIVLEEITPFTYMGVRFLIAAILLGVVVAIRGRPRFSRRTHLLIALTAFAEPVAYFLFESFGIRLIPATTASLIIATTPLAVMVLAAIFLGEPIRRGGVLAVVVSISGIALLVLGGDDGASGTSGSGGDLLGTLLVFGAVLSAAFYITLARNLTQRHDPVNLTVFQTWWGTGVFVVLWRLQPPASRTVAALSPDAWIALIFLAIGATVVAFMLYNWALRHETAGTASLYINAIPVVTALTGRFVLDERLSLIQLVGGAMVLASVRLAVSAGRTVPVEEVAEAVPPEG